MALRIGFFVILSFFVLVGVLRWRGRRLQHQRESERRRARLGEGVALVDRFNEGHGRPLLQWLAPDVDSQLRAHRLERVAEELDVEAVRAKLERYRDIDGWAVVAARVFVAHAEEVRQGVVADPDDPRFAGYVEWIERAEALLQRRGDPADPLVGLVGMRCAFGLALPAEELWRRYRLALSHDPCLVEAHSTMLTHQSRRWGGRHSDMFELARRLVAEFPEHPVQALMGQVNVEYWFEQAVFGEVSDDALGEILADPERRAEVASAFDRAVQHQRASPSGLQDALRFCVVWFYLVDDHPRLARCWDILDDPWDAPWSWVGDEAVVRRSARARAYRGGSEKLARLVGGG